MAFAYSAAVNVGDELTCSICLNVYRDPVTLSCGHNFCRQCLDKVWATPTRGKGYSCPDCCGVYKQRPVYQHNLRLRNIVEQIEADQVRKGNTIICCDFCLDDPLPSVKICETCEVSLCQLHLRKHQDKFSRKAHVLVEPTMPVQDRKCSDHDRFLEYYCSDDQAFICASCCTVGSHRAHQIQTLTEAHQEKRVILQQDIELMIQSRETLGITLQQLRKAQTDLKLSNGELRAQVQNAFEEIRNLINQQEKEVLDSVTAEEASQLTILSQGIQNVEQKQNSIEGLIQEALSLCDQTDGLYFTQTFKSLHEKIQSNDPKIEQVIIEEKQMDKETLQKVQQRAQAFINEINALITWQLRQSSGLILCLLNHSGTASSYESIDSCTNSPGVPQSVSTPTYISQDKSALLKGYRKVTLKPCHLETEPDSLYSLQQKSDGCWTLRSGFIFFVMEKEVFPHFKCNPRLSSGNLYWEVDIFSTGHGRWSVGATHHQNESYRIHWDDSELWACAWKTSHKKIMGRKITFPVRITVLLSYEQGRLSFYQNVPRDKQLQPTFFQSAQDSNSLIHLHTFDFILNRHVVPGFSLWACDIKFL